MPGPTPSANRQARPGRDLPWVDLPADGRTEPVPDVPAAFELRAPGSDLWADLWATPMATQWGVAETHQVARLCQLTDRLVRQDDTKVLAEMRHLETALGLTAKARKELRWRIVADGEIVEQNGGPTPAGRRRGLRVVDPVAADG